MKYCLSSRCSKTYLEQSDEIKVEWRDRAEIPDLPIKYPSLDILLQFTPSQIQDNIPWEELETYNTICQGKFILVCDTPERCREAKERGFRFYYGFPINSFALLHTLKDMGAEYARLGPALFFDMPAAAKVGLPIRVIPNIAYDDGWNYKDGVCGTWIRPEDMDVYEPYVAAVEFEDCAPTKETALYRVYALGHGWKTDIADLVTNIGMSAYNPMLSKDMSRRRLTCKQRRSSSVSSMCEACRVRFKLADYEKLENYKEKLMEGKED